MARSWTEKHDRPVDLSVILPVYNEEETIPAALNRICTFLGNSSMAGEIIVVCDGCEDESPDVARRVLNSNPLDHRILEYRDNSGKGQAVKRGMQEARGYYCLFLDVDLSTPITTLNSCEQYFSEDQPVIIGSRNLSQSRIQNTQPWFRRVMGEGFIYLANFLLNLSISDYTCGFKVFRWDVAQEICSRSTIQGFVFDAEALFLARRMNYPVTEIAVRWSHDERTKVKVTREIHRSFYNLLKIRKNEYCGIYN